MTKQEEVEQALNVAVDSAVAVTRDSFSHFVNEMKTRGISLTDEQHNNLERDFYGAFLDELAKARKGRT